MQLFEELKRRNVIRVGAAYVVAAWLIIQVVETLFPIYELPDAAVRFVVTALAVGFIPVVLLAWAFEFTPEGLKWEKDVDRSASVTRQTGKQLDRIIIVILALAVGFFAFDKFALSESREAAIAESAREEGRSEAHKAKFYQSIAVLPFANRSNREDDVYFVDGVHDDILTQLAHIEALAVTSRTSVEQYRATTKTIKAIAEELEVRAILEGGVQRAGDQVRINVQLIDATNDDHLWAETYVRELTAANIFSVQGDIASSVASALAATLMPEEELALAAVPTESIEAYDLYLLGRFHWRQRTKESIELARDYFLQAIEIDPEYVPALAGLADSYTSLVFYGTMLADDAYPLAQQAIDQAMALDDSVSAVWASQGLLHNNNRNFSAALSSLEHAIELDPKNVEAWYWLSFPLEESGRLTDAFEAIKKANELEPMIPSINNALARFYEGYGDFARRRQYLERVAQSTEARRRQTNVRIAESYLAGGDIARAVEDYRASLASAPEDLRALTGIGAAYLALGDTREAERWYEVAAASGPFYAGHYQFYLAREDFAGAISLIENTLEHWAPQRPGWLISPLFTAHYLAGNTGEARGYLDEIMEIRQGRYELTDLYNQSEGLNIASFWINFGDDATGERQRGLELAREIRDKFAGLHAQGFRHPQLLAHLAAAEGILGNHKVAFGFLEAAIDKGFRDAFGELTQPIFDPLRDDAGFAAVTERIAGLSAQERARLEGIELAPYTPTSRLKPIALPRKTIERFLGYYTDRNRIFHLFMSSDGQLMGSLPGFGTGPLFMASEIRFFSTAFPNQYGELAYDEDGTVSHLMWHAGTNIVLWKRIPDLPPAIQLSADVFSRFEGVYAYDELGGLNTERTGADTLVAVISRDENGTPWIDYEKQPKLELEAVSESVLRVKGFVGRMEFEFDPDTGTATQYSSHSDTGVRVFVRQDAN